MDTRDPYDRAAIIDACASHAWERHGDEFISHGISSENALKNHIFATLEHEDTQAFRCQPQMALDQAFGREVYSLPFENSPKGEGYSTSIILNPNLDESGDYYGGTCQIRSDERGEFARLQRQEVRETGIEPEIVIGGRPALREQEQDRQIVTAEKDPLSLDTAQAVPQTLEEYLWQRENLSLESLDYTPQELPRTFEEYLHQCEENLYPQQTTDKDQEQDLER